MCQASGCKTRPYFNFQGELKAIFCNTHKEKGMIDIKNKTCQHDGCKKHPSFNFNSESTAIFCNTHKKAGMIDIKSKTCQHEGCTTQPCFNYEGQKGGIFCSMHKDAGMIDIKNKTCHHDECKTLPNYNFAGQTRSIFCSIHKEDGMIDIKHKPCQYEGCNTRPSFNFNSELTAIFCNTHKKEGMIDIKNKTCRHECCKTRPSFNFNSELTAIFCNTHKKEGMIILHAKTCKYEWCSTYISNEQYERYCLRCFIHTFPDKKVSRNYKTKEGAVTEFVKNSFPDVDWVVDKTVQGGCSRRRPDIFLDLGDQIMIVEVDENQHQGYDCSCHNKRIMQLSQDVGHVPIIFIRFNPDSYMLQNTMVTSCWGTDKKGLSVVKKSKQEEWKRRLLSLIEQIDYWKEHRTQKLVEVVELFYDQ